MPRLSNIYVKSCPTDNVADEKTMGMSEENSFSFKISVTRRGMIISVISSSDTSTQSTASFSETNNSIEKIYCSKYSSTIFKSYSGIIYNSPSNTNSSNSAVEMDTASFPTARSSSVFLIAFRSSPPASEFDFNSRKNSS